MRFDLDKLEITGRMASRREGGILLPLGRRNTDGVFFKAKAGGNRSFAAGKKEVKERERAEKSVSSPEKGVVIPLLDKRAVGPTRTPWKKTARKVYRSHRAASDGENGSAGSTLESSRCGPARVNPLQEGEIKEGR